MVDYHPRIADGLLRRLLAAFGAVLIDGPKACGKTETARQLAATVFNVDEDAGTRNLIREGPAAVFAKPRPILFDEWQAEPEVWNRVRRQVDQSSEKGQFILTGSSTPDDDARRHSGAGRIGVVPMRPMSLFESGHSTGAVSLAQLFNGEPAAGPAHSFDLVSITERIVIGGWPELIGVSEEPARDWLAGYLTQISEIDVQRLGARRDPRNIRRLLSSLARFVAQTVPNADLARDVGGDSGEIARDTLTTYLNALDRLHLIDNSEPWRPHMRSRTALRAAPVRYFVDPSLGPAAMNVGSSELLADPATLGLHFEALAVRDLRIYSQPLRGVIDSWREAGGHEVDAVVSVNDNKWGAIEVKLGQRSIDKAAGSLAHFATKVDQARHGAPAFLAVVTATGAEAYRRIDGIDVIPIGALGP